MGVRGMERIGLQDAIAALRGELIDSIVASQGEGLRFEVGEIMMEFQIEVERSAEGKGGIKFWVVELGAGAAVKDKDVHKVTIPLKPVRYDGKPILTGSDEVPD
jgi:Trypsin-co-occurring domain 2